MSYFSGIDQRIRQQTFFNNSSTTTQPLTQTNTELLANLQYVQNYFSNFISGYLTSYNPIFTGTLSTLSGLINVPSITTTTSNITTANITTANIATASIESIFSNNANITYQNQTTFEGNPYIRLNSISYPIQFRIIGEIKMIVSTATIPNYLLCDGSAISTTQYQNLFNIIGYSYGGSGTTFYTPSFASRFIIGGNNSNGKVSTSNYATGNGQGGYNNTTSFFYNYNNSSTNSTPLLVKVPSHNHETILQNSDPSTITPVGVQNYTYTTGSYQGIATLNTGSNVQSVDPISGGGGVNITPSYIACNFWICYQ